MSSYYLAVGGQQQGPYPLSELPARGMRADTLVWREGMAQWLPADQVPEITSAGLLGNVGPPIPVATVAPPVHAPHQPYPPPYAGTVVAGPANSNKIAAGICGILLGGLGIHKFILGFSTSGVIMLLVSLVGGFITCGIASMVMSIIGIIEGIIYLTKSDEQFYQTYVVQKKEWFWGTARDRSAFSLPEILRFAQDDEWARERST